VEGTRKHNDDHYSRLMANPAYSHRLERAILDESRGEVLMPERWNFERLVQDREEIGTALFNREKQNEVIDEATALFKREWLESCLDPGRRLWDPSPPGCVTVQGVDPACVSDPLRAEERDSDFSAVVTLAAEPEGRLFVVDLWMERGLSPEGLIGRILELGARFRPRLVVVENNAFQHWLENELSARSLYPVLGHTTRAGNKASLFEGVPSLAALFERGRVSLPAGDERSRRLCGLLIDQLHGLGLERHDDLAMAFWFAVLGARKVTQSLAPAPSLGALVRRF